MLHNYFVIAWRNIWRRAFVSLLNIFGLSIAIALCFVIGIYVWQEYNVNANLSNIDRQYVLKSRWKDPNMGLEHTTIAGLPRALKEQYPDIVANYHRWDGITVVASNNDRHFREVVSIGDSTLFKMYGFRFMYGDTETALNNPSTLVITEDKALKYFGKTDVIGKTVNLENFSGEKKLFTVTGVLKKLSRNTITQFGDSNFSFFLPITSAKFFGANVGWLVKFLQPSG